MQGPILRPLLRASYSSNPLRRAICTAQAVGCSHWIHHRNYSISTDCKQKDTVNIPDDLFGDDDPQPQPVQRDERSEKLEEGLELEIGEISDNGSLPAFKDQVLHRPKLPGSIKRLNRILSRQRKLEIPESDLDEKFVKGRGPGGQAINKTNSSVSLTHIPTGIRVQAQPTRSREENRKAARRILAEKLDMLRSLGQLPGYENEQSKNIQLESLLIPISKAEQREEGEGEGEGKKKGKKALQKEEEQKLSGTYTKAEIKAEKERRRKSNRAKKAKKKYGKKGEIENDDTIEREIEIDETSQNP
ncbi:uncharacterized protein IL334_003509 [Kwoniella shivajii]|uniref:Prokaryotic-type class I peptide chain release factors domain-containing protein n=1 Tax=Kwoniella shivajii TaxID=564305 RepID=A0ABZ1CXS1_9TREE|nr:hypothetical protein IL334_003509 [Kwoniella shivajii]